MRKARKRLHKLIVFMLTVAMMTSLCTPLQSLAQETAAEVVTEETSEEASEEVSEEVSEETSEEASEEISEEVSEETSEEASEEVSEEVSEETSEEASEEISEEVSEEASEEASEDISEEVSEETSEEVSEEVSEENGAELLEEPKDTVPVSIDEAHFPDAEFRGFVSENFDIDSDGILSVEELKAVTEIKMKWMVADSVKGIEYFTELTVFKSEINTLTELDLSANTKLETVVCTLGSLKSVNFKNLKNLIDLNCSYNSLEELDLSDCVELKFLQAANNNIRTIDLRSCTKLESIQLCGNELTAIDISNCPNLDFLDCESNRINSLNLTGADFLEYLYLSDNRIGVLDVSSCKKLSTLTLNNNGLKSLNVKGCDRLSELYLFNNQLKSIDLSSNKELRQLNVAMNSLVALDVKANTNLTELECYGNTLKSLDVSGNKELTFLTCSNNELTELDVTNNVLLEGLDCQLNKIRSLDVSKNVNLTCLNIQYNHICEMDLENNPNLYEFSSYGNTYQADIPGNTFDLSTLPGNFDPARVISIYASSGYVARDGNIITISDNAELLFFTYDTGLSSHVLYFRLQRNPRGIRAFFANPDEEYVYNGTAWKPAVVVMNDGTNLTEGIDYTLKYSNNVNASVNAKKKPSVTITFKGSISGKTTLTYEIQPRDLKEVSYSGNVIAVNTAAKPVLIYNGKKLANKKDFTSDTYGKKYAEDGMMLLTGKGNFKGTLEIPIDTVEKSELKKFKVTLSQTKYPYTGYEQKPAISVTDAKTGQALMENIDYRVDYPVNIVDAGTKKITIAGLGNYTGSVNKSYTITPEKATNILVTISNSNAIYYDPNGVTLGNKLQVTKGGYSLKEGVDYKVSYSANKKAGTGKCKVTFMGNYKGTKAVTKTFTILPADINLNRPLLEINCMDKVYTGKPGTYVSKPYVDYKGKTLKSSDYKVEYFHDFSCYDEITKKNPIELDDSVANVYIRITAKGNYTGSITMRGYRVVGLEDELIDLSGARITILDEEGNKCTKFAYTGKEVSPKVKVEVKVGKEYVTVSPSKYEVRYVNNCHSGKATLFIQGDQYQDYTKGSKKATFSIGKNSVKK